MLNTPDQSGDSWPSNDLMDGVWEQARKVVSASESIKLEAVASSVFEAWIAFAPKLSSDIESIYRGRFDSKSGGLIGQLSTVILGEMTEEDQLAFGTLVNGTSITALGLFVLSLAFRMRHPEREGKNAILVSDSEERAESLLESEIESLLKLRHDFNVAFDAILDAGHESPLIRAAAIRGLCLRLETTAKEVYGRVYVVQAGAKRPSGRKTAISSDAISNMIHNFVQTSILGKRVSDYSLHPPEADTLEKHRSVADDISKGNAKIVSYLREYRDYLCDFFGTPAGPLRSDPLVVPRKPGRPRQRATHS